MKKVNTYNFIFKVAALFLLMMQIPQFSFSMGKEDSAAFYYENKNYEASARCYESILSEGKESWIIHFNLGNAYYKNGQLGNAIYHYEIARKFNPSQPDLLNNLRIADSKMQDKMEVKENFLEREIRLGVIHFFTPTGWAWISIITLLICLSLFFIFRITTGSIQKKLSFWTSALSGLIFIFSMFMGYSALREKQSRNRGVIIKNDISFYTEPRSENKKNFQLHEGTRVKVLTIDNDWTNIQLQNGNEGWIHSGEVGLY